MRIHVPSSALGLALVAIAPTAQAQTVYAPQPAVTVAPPPLVAPPVRTVRTVTTVRRVGTLRPLARHRVVVSRRRYVRDPVVPTTTTTTTTTSIEAAPAVATAYPAPVYDYAPPAALVPEPSDAQPLYDTVVSTPAPAPAPGIVPTTAVPAAVPVYQYVYQHDRILVIDPNTGIAVQAIPR